MFKNLLVLPALLLSSIANAHPGEHHGGFFSVIAHLLSEPDHMILAALAVAAGIGGALYLRRRSR